MHGTPPDLDAIDERLITALQRDGRTSYETLARLTGQARSTTKQRVQRLLDAGLRIVGVTHPAVTGRTLFSHLALEASGPARPIAERLAALDNASYVTATGGRFAVTAELRTADTETFAGELARVHALPGVRAVHVITNRRVWKDPYFPPAAAGTPPLPAGELDPADHAILTHLREDGRASYARLAEVSGLSPGATRARVLRLLETGTLHVGAHLRLRPLSRTHTTGFAVTARAATRDWVRRITELDEVEYFTTGIGWCAGTGTIRTTSPGHEFATLERVRALDGVDTVEAWQHLRTFKEEYETVDAPGG